MLWAAYSPDSLSREAAGTIQADANTILVSAVSAWEIANKVRLGKLPQAERLEKNFIHFMDASGYQFLPISLEQALRAGRLPGVHRDPFDRMIAAQALALDIPVISNDAKLDSLGVRRLW